MMVKAFFFYVSNNRSWLRCTFVIRPSAEGRPTSELQGQNRLVVKLHLARAGSLDLVVCRMLLILR